MEQVSAYNYCDSCRLIIVSDDKSIHKCHRCVELYMKRDSQQSFFCKNSLLG